MHTPILLGTYLLFQKIPLFVVCSRKDTVKFFVEFPVPDIPISMYGSLLINPQTSPIRDFTGEQEGFLEEGE